MNTAHGIRNLSKLSAGTGFCVFLAVSAAYAAGEKKDHPTPAHYGIEETEQETETPPAPSVNLREEFTFHSHQSIDSFLGEF